MSGRHAASRAKRRSAAPRRRFQPRLEALEPRTLLACEVFAREGTLFIYGDDAANAVSVAASGPSVQVICDDQRALFFDGIDRIVAELGAGDDVFVAELTSPAGRIASDFAAIRLSVHGGRGDDDIQVFMGIDPEPFLPSLLFDVSADGGAGHDSISAHIAVLDDEPSGIDPPATPPIARFNVALRGGAGDDDLNAVMGIEPQPFLPAVMADWSIDGGGGHDAIAVVADILALMGTSHEQSLLGLEVHAGAGHDLISIDVNLQSDTDARIAVDAGAGDDTLNFRYDALNRLARGETGTEGPVSELLTTIRLGDGADTADVVVQSNDPDIAFEMHGGPGNDDMHTNFDLPNPGEPLDAIGPEEDIITGVTSMGESGLVQVFDGTTAAKLQEFNSFSGGFVGLPVAAGDVNGDGVDDIIRGTARVPVTPSSFIPGATEVKIFDGLTGLVLHGFDAYDPTTVDGVYVAAGDVNGDGIEDIVTGPQTGPPLVKVFDGATGMELASFLAFDPSFTGGVRVAAGDVDGDGIAEIVIGAGSGATPDVKVFDALSQSLLISFDAYGPAVDGGVFVAVGDVTGDGLGEIVTGPGASFGVGGPRVQVFDGVTGAQINFLFNHALFAFDDTERGDVRVAVGNINGDGIGDIIVGTGRGAPPQVRVFDGATGDVIADFVPLASSAPQILQPEVFVAAGNVNSQRRKQTIGFAAADGDDHLAVSVQTVNAINLRADGGAGSDDISAVMGINPEPFLPNSESELNVAGGAGPDDISVLADINAAMGVQPEQFRPTVSTELNVNGGGGDDAIAVLAEINAVMGVEPEPFLPNVLTQINVHGGAGHDGISVLADINAVMGIQPEPFLPAITTEVSVNGGVGDDNISVLADINAAMGVDPEPFRPAEFRFDLEVRGGLGHDDISAVMGVEPTPFLPQIKLGVILDGGSGNDALSADFRSAAAGQIVAVLLVALLGGDGDDTLRLLWTDEAFLALAFADGGDGFDTGVFSPGVRHINVERLL